MVLELGFHGFDVATRLIEEAVFHPTPLYSILDTAFGISKFDPFVQLGIYNMAKSAIGAQTVPLPFSTQISVPLALPTPPLAAGGQLPSRKRIVKGRAQIFG
jgi:hypothetical protein